MRAGVITFPGSNCDEDCRYSLEQTAGFQVQSIWHKAPSMPNELDLVVLPGGFSYGDYLRTGAIAAVSPIMAAVKEFAERGGLVLGICNGFQILCEAGLLPGALVKNQRCSFVCKDVLLQITDDNPWTHPLVAGTQLNLPVAHGEGRYVIDSKQYDELEKCGQILFRYQEDINGSFHQIAGITNKKKNVCGMMPHPERASDLRSRDGLKIWNAIGLMVRERP